MTESVENKKRTRKHRVKGLEKFGFETGKLYKFNGRFRKMYLTQNMHLTSFQERLDNYKIRHGDHVMFFDADLWRSSSVKRKFVKEALVEKTRAILEAKGFKIIRVEPYKSHPIQSRSGMITKKFYNIYYRNSEEKYSGRLYIGHGEKFGWINIVQLEKDQILSQFVKVEI